MGEAPLHLVGEVDGRPLRHVLREGPCLIGRAAECEIRLPLHAVSRQHVRLTTAGGRVRLQDLGSRNGTLVNGRPAEREVELAPGDEIDVAGVLLRLGRDDEPPPVPYAPHETILTSGMITWDESRAQAPAGEQISRLFPVLAEAGELLSRSAEPEELYDPILDLVERALSPDRIFLLLLEGERGEPAIRASRLRGRRSGEGIVLSRTLLDRVVQEKRSFLTADALDDPLLRAQASIVTMSVRSAMAVPMFDNRRVIGVLYADSSDPQRRYMPEELRALTLLANVVAVAITNARHRVLDHQRRRLEAELETARRLLERILPAEAPACAGWDIAFRLEPCHEVAGDLCEARLLPDGRLLLLIGDVSGKGLGAALTVVQILSLLRLLADQLIPPADLLERLNDQLFQTTESERFVTLFLGLLEPASGRLQYVNGGHDPPCLLTAGGELKELAATGPLVGAFPGLPFVAAELHLAPGDLLLLYTDGVTETLGADGAEFGRERLQASLRLGAAHGAEELIAKLLADVTAFRGDGTDVDDVTLVALRRKPGGAAGA